MFCKRPFALQCEQPQKDKQNVDVAPHWKNVFRHPWLLSPFQQALTYRQVRQSYPCTELKTEQNVLWRHNRSWKASVLLNYTTVWRWNKSTHCSVRLHCLFLILECSTNVINSSKMNNLKAIQEFSRTPENIQGQQDLFQESRTKPVLIANSRAVLGAQGRLATLVCSLAHLLRIDF